MWSQVNLKFVPLQEGEDDSMVDVSSRIIFLFNRLTHHVRAQVEAATDAVAKVADPLGLSEVDLKMIQTYFTTGEIDFFHPSSSRYIHRL